MLRQQSVTHLWVVSVTMGCVIWFHRRYRWVQTLLALAVCTQPALCNLHHLAPTHTRAKLSHGKCVPPNGLFSKMGKIAVHGEDNLMQTADECAAACQ